MTMRRAQGSTLEAVVLYFDRKRPDRGYAYVAASRVRSKLCLYHMGPIRRTDWLPVGGDQDYEEQMYLSVLSESDSEDEREQEDSEDDASDGFFKERADDSDDLESFGDSLSDVCSAYPDSDTMMFEEQAAPSSDDFATAGLF